MAEVLILLRGQLLDLQLHMLHLYMGAECREEKSNNNLQQSD